MAPPVSPEERESVLKAVWRFRNDLIERGKDRKPEANATRERRWQQVATAVNGELNQTTCTTKRAKNIYFTAFGKLKALKREHELYKATNNLSAEAEYCNIYDSLSAMESVLWNEYKDTALFVGISLQGDTMLLNDDQLDDGRARGDHSHAENYCVMISDSIEDDHVGDEAGCSSQIDPIPLTNTRLPVPKMRTSTDSLLMKRPRVATTQNPQAPPALFKPPSISAKRAEDRMRVDSDKKMQEAMENMLQNVSMSLAKMNTLMEAVSVLVQVATDGQRKMNVVLDDIISRLGLTPPTDASVPNANFVPNNQFVNQRPTSPLYTDGSTRSNEL